MPESSTIFAQARPFCSSKSVIRIVGLKQEHGLIVFQIIFAKDEVRLET